MRRVVTTGHRWNPDTNQGWSWCVCLNRCGWKRITTTIASVSNVEFIRDGEVLDQEPLCDPECDE